jgi:hypothetical protein
MKLLLTFLSLTFTFAAFANAPEHKASHANTHASQSGANLNLFPPPQADSAKASRPNKPELTEPNFHAKITGDSVTLKWNAVDSVNAYHLQVATDPNFKWIVSESPMMSETSFQVSGLQKSTHYFWRVAAVKSENDATYMKSWFSGSEFEVQ